MALCAIKMLHAGTMYKCISVLTQHQQSVNIWVKWSDISGKPQITQIQRHKQHLMKCAA